MFIVQKEANKGNVVRFFFADIGRRRFGSQARRLLSRRYFAIRNPRRERQLYPAVNNLLEWN